MTTYVWSIDDAGSGGGRMVESLRRTSQFFSSRGLGSTWFTVPKAGANLFPLLGRRHWSPRVMLGMICNCMA